MNKTILDCPYHLDSAVSVILTPSVVIIPHSDDVLPRSSMSDHFIHTPSIVSTDDEHAC